MVGEFPDLQGVMGGHYARANGEVQAVYEAIAGHYAPRGPDEACPTAPESVAVALADKLDTLAGFFAIDERPTGSKDPFALRRAALGVIRIIVESELRLDLKPVLADALAGHSELRLKTSDAAEIGYDLLIFIGERFRVRLREVGMRHDLVSAVFQAGDETDLVRPAGANSKRLLGS